MNFEYFENSQHQLRKILGSVAEFQDQLMSASAVAELKQVSVKPLTPGLSGAAVFLVRRIGAQGPLVPWVAKVASDANLIITGEGRLDAQSLMGKVIAGVGRVAREADVPVVALVGSIGDGADKCLEVLDDYAAISPPDMPREQALARAPGLLESAAAAAIRRRMSC